jgi:predicted NAD/FAD-binding protein
MPSCTAPAPQVTVSYWMNLLGGIRDRDDHVVTLDPEGHVDPATVTARMRYDHPVFTADAVTAAARLRRAGGDRLAFAGAHLGWGFHEDGCRSGVEAAERFGVRW